MSLKSIFYLLYPTQSPDIVIIHMSDYQVTMYSDTFKDFFKNTTTEEGIFNDDGNLFQSELPLN